MGRSNITNKLDKPLGSTTITLPANATEWPIVGTYSLANVPSPGLNMSPPLSKVKVVWELIQGHAEEQPLEGTNDLTQIARMGEMSLIEHHFTVNATVNKLTLNPAP